MMAPVSRLCFVLLLHLFLVFDSVDRANAQETSALRSQQKERKYQQHDSHFLGKKFLALTGNTQILHFNDASKVKEVVHDATSHFLRQPYEHTKLSEEIIPRKAEDEEPFPRRRLSMLMAVASSSPSAITRHGFALSASIQHAQIAFKTMGDLLQRGGQKLKKGTVATVKTMGRNLQSALSFLLRQHRRMIAFIVIGTMKVLQSMVSGLETIADKTDVLKDSPAPVAKAPSTTPSSNASTPPVMSRISTPTSSSLPSSATSATNANLPTWSSSSRSSAPVVAKTTPTKKKTQAISNMSIKNLMSGFKKSNDDKSIEVAPEPSFLGGMFSSLMSGLLVLSAGALVGYLWTDWRDERQEATMRNVDFVDATDLDLNVRSLRSRAVPITPDASRYQA